jgi:excisionase family DNA binding protein
MVLKFSRSEQFPTPQASKVPETLNCLEMEATQQKSEWLTAAEAAQYLKVQARTLLMWARQGKVKGYTLSGTHRITWRFRVGDLDATLLAPSVAPQFRRD